MSISKLRELMAKHAIDAVIIPHTDPHQSEYIADHWQVRRYLSGFTGSAGTLVVTTDKALLWTDSRYFIQAAQQLADTGIELMRDGLSTTPSIDEYLCTTLAPGSRVGVDGMMISVVAKDKMTKTFDANYIQLVTDFDVTDEFWPDRPTLPKNKIFVLDTKYSGKTTKEKIADILADVQSQGANSTLISALDEIAWTLNIRCKDVKYNPVATSYLFVDKDKTTLFIDKDKLDQDAINYMKANGIYVDGYDDIQDFLLNLPSDRKILVEPAKTSASIFSSLGKRAVCGLSPISVAKGCKNDAEIAGIRKAMVRDGVAMVKAFMEIENKLATGQRITEMDVAAILLKYRSEQDLFFDESFGTIAGYGPHGAIVHYEADAESDVALEPHGLLLVDSGAQYIDGTTDITRTICLGTPTQQEKHDFTLVMKGNIALDTMVFPVGTRGAQLDVEARKFLWREGLTYLHGTGHGVGHFLNVHEGPQTIRLNDTPIPLMVGMVTSNEPGLYRENVHGVRCENLVLCVPAMTTDFGEFLKFETLTLYPFDLKLFETEIMSKDEIEWVNNYHRTVYDKLSPYLSDAECQWLKEKTQPLG